jgi:hypothetical protein
MPPLSPEHAAPTNALPREQHAPIDPQAGELPAGHPPMAGAHGGVPAGHGAAGNPHGGDAALEAATPGDIPFDAKTVLAGLIKVDGKHKDKIKKGEVIYLVARGAGQAGAPGPVLAVRRLEVAEFPMPFQLDSRDAMMVGTKLAGPLVLTARVDKDGDAMTKNPGDVTGTLSVKALPAAKLSLVLDTIL